MIKNILIPQDGSENAGAALEYGLWLARKFKAGLIGLHVVDVVALEGPFLHDLSGSLGFEPFLNFSAKMREALETRGKTIISAFEAACAKEGLESESSVGYGVVAGEICDKARLADLVILGRRGLNARFEYGLLGSTTEAVLRRSPKPVMVVPERFAGPQRPLLAYDGSPTASRAMHSAAEWASAFDLPLTVVSVAAENEGEPAFLKDAENYLKPYGVRASFVALKGDAPIAIERYCKDNGHDIVFMGASHHSRIVAMVLGSTSEHVMRNVEVPFFLER
ncbi:MAG: universal stress protein [Deltaproteobacteria bacterium]|nr:universal stress protein [Deltaproteobacteria bacterium]